MDPSKETKTNTGTIVQPILEKVGPHPVGTSVGAAGGAVAGAVIGTAVGGPVGTIVGGATGAATGALVGEGAAEIVNPKKK